MKHEPDITRIDIHPVVERLTQVRLAWGLTVPEVSKRIGISWGALHRLENGKREPGFKVLTRWADALGYDLSIWPRDGR